MYLFGQEPPAGDFYHLLTAPGKKPQKDPTHFNSQIPLHVLLSARSCAEKNRQCKKQDTILAVTGLTCHGKGDR